MTMTLNETDLAIRTFFAEYLNDPKQGKACIGHKEPKVVLCSGNYRHRLIYRALCEGTLGRAFRTYTAADPKGAMRVIRFALDMWDKSEYNPNFLASQGTVLNKPFSVGLGAFAHNFTGTVAEMAEPHLPAFVNHFGQSAWMADAWDWFASNVSN